MNSVNSLNNVPVTNNEALMDMQHLLSCIIADRTALDGAVALRGRATKAELARLHYLDGEVRRLRAAITALVLRV